jgi:hypothetical protein
MNNIEEVKTMRQNQSVYLEDRVAVDQLNIFFASEHDMARAWVEILQFFHAGVNLPP